MGELAMDDDDSISRADSAAGKKKASPPRGRFARWTIRLLILTIALFAAIVICLQIILWTDIPRKMVVQKLQTVLGLRVDAQAISIGWGGHTTLTDVKISLPLAQQSLLQVPRLEVTHTSLPMILLTQDITLKDVQFHQPSMLVVQDPAGQWNVSEAVELITRASGKEQAQKETPGKSLALPAVTVDDGTLKLIDRNARTATVQDLNVSGHPDGPLVWKYDLGIADQVKLTGQVSPGGNWEHEVDFAIRHLDRKLSEWARALPEFQATGSWHGEVDGAVVAGRVTFDHLNVGSLSARGAAGVQRQASGEVIISPQALVLQTTNEFVRRASITAGTLTIGGTSATAKELSVSLNGGQAKLDGRYSWADQSASIRADWNDVALPQGFTESGSVTAKLTTPWPGAPRIEAQVNTSGRTPFRTWNMQAALSGEGRSWGDIDWTATISRASWIGKHRASIAGLTATAAMRAQKVTLTSLSLDKGGDLNGSGEVNLDDLAWHLSVSGENISIDPLSDDPLAFQLDTSGKGGALNVDSLYLQSGEIEISAKGSYDSTKPRPISASVVLSHLPALESSVRNAPFRGRVYGQASVSGTLAPLEVTIDEGLLKGADVYLKHRNLGNVAIRVVGRVTEDEAQIETTDAKLLGGNWHARMDWPGEKHGVRVLVGVRELPLAEIGELLEHPDVSGKASGEWTIDIPAADRRQIQANGKAELSDISIGPFKAQHIIAHSKLVDGILTLAPIQLKQQDGEANAHIDLAIERANQMNVRADVKNWPATAPSGYASASISAHTELAVDLSKQSATGPLTADASVVVNGQSAGTFTLASRIDGRTINVYNLQASALGGTMQGNGAYLLDQPTSSKARLTWSNLDAAKVAAFVPKAVELTGGISGSATLAPCDDPRALGPLKLQASIKSDDLRYKSIEIGSADVLAYLDTGQRIVLDRANFSAAKGTIDLWARTTTHGEGVRSTQVQIQFKDLDLDELDRAFDPTPAAMPGKVQGSFALVGPLRYPDRLFGEGRVKITDSNLVNLEAIRGLYDLMHIGADSAGNTGTGSFNLRLDNNALTMENGRYFNRGVQVRARASIADVWKSTDSPLQGVVIGSLRPLKDIKLPYFADADRILNALQQDLTAVKVTGTARDYKVTPISLDEVGETMQKVIVGEVKKD